MGKALRVDLTKNKVTYDDLGKEFDSHIGGSGFSTAVISRELDPLVKPLGPENVLVFATGPLTGTNAPTSGRYVVAAKSPLTGFWGEADSGGFWGAELKFAGFDAIIIKGVARAPSYLWVHDDVAEIKGAENLVGLSTYETERALKKEWGAKAKVASIGPAGEKLVKFAIIANDTGRMAGRTGMGAVMGSKNLKAIAVSGEKTVEVKDAKGVRELRNQIAEKLQDSPGAISLHKVGTGAGLEFFHSTGNLPLKNWAGDTWDLDCVRAISKNKFLETRPAKRRACFACPIACSIEMRCGDGEGHGPEYETLAALGSLCLVGDPDDLIMGNDLCNRYGIDTIETGTIVAMIMECFEKGILTEKEVGLKLEWGDGKAMNKIIPMMAQREGFGDTLAEGVKAAAARIGRGAPELAMHVKGASLPMHDPRVQPHKALSYATLSSGAYHGKGGSAFIGKRVDAGATEELVNEVIWRQNISEIIDSLIMCSFVFENWAGAIPIDFIPKLLSAVTGRERDITELYRIGGDIVNMKRDFISRIGVKSKDYELPSRFAEIPRVRNNVRNTANVKPLLPAYYAARGWKAE